MNEKNQESQPLETPQAAETEVMGKNKNGTSGLAVAGLVVGIVAIIGSWVPLLNLVSAWIAIIAIGLSLAGLIVVKKGTKSGKGPAIAGLVMGIATIILVIVMYVGADALSDDTEDAATSNNTTQTETADTKDSGIVENEGDLNDYHIKIGKSKMTSDYDGKAAILINYEFTNNSTDSISFDMALSAKAYQNGVELDSAIFSDEDDSYLKDVKPGVTFKVKRVYVLDDESADVEVEVTQLISFNEDKVIKTFGIK